jgi:tetratricopeptide (TPR) repeat protein
LRAIALVHLGRRDDAARTIDGALAASPEDAVTHANQGWTLLHQGDPKRAMTHFREALRLDPTSDWARAGIVEAMKARNPIYRWLLGFFLWMSRLSPGARWGIILGGWFGNRVLRGVAATNPSLAPFIWPITTVYILFVLMTWLAPPLFNAMLRLDRDGRHALSREQIITSNWILSLLTIAAGSFIGLLATGVGWLEILTVVALLLAIPVSTIWRCDEGWPRRANVAIAVALALVGSAMVYIAVTNGSAELFDRLFGVFVVGTLAASFVVQSLVSAKPQR